MDLKFEAEAVLFDKDGTLIHYDASWAPYVPKLFEKLAPEREDIWEEMAHAVGFDIQTEKFIVGSIAVNGTFEDVIAVLERFVGPIDMQNALAADTYAHQYTQPAPVGDLNALLEDFKSKGLKLGVVTNDLIAATEKQLKQMDNRDMFDVIYCADSGPQPKPAGDMITAACRDLGIAPERVAMVGDSTHDLHAGRAAGVGLKVGVLTGPAKHDDIDAFADIVLSDIHQLPAYLI
ncbi:MAG: HAD family hydrolase [Pseudomonadota bacterium]